MAKKPTGSKKTFATRKRKTAKPAYLREIQIRYKKKRVKAGSPVGKKIIRAVHASSL